MDYDPLLQRAQNARETLKSAIRKARAAQEKAKTELDLLYELEATLNLDAIVEAVPAQPPSGD